MKPQIRTWPTGGPEFPTPLTTCQARVDLLHRASVVSVTGWDSHIWFPSFRVWPLQEDEARIRRSCRNTQQRCRRKSASLLTRVRLVFLSGWLRDAPLKRWHPHGCSEASSSYLDNNPSSLCLRWLLALAVNPLLGLSCWRCGCD